VLLVASGAVRTASFAAVVKTGPGRGVAVSSFRAAGTYHVCLKFWYEVKERKVELQIMNCESNVNVVASGVKQV
jgi:hypothetical protein